ncbi:MAG: lipocalin family protein [Lentisphaeria bacterium]|nr:lipocalin family protein [Lentisphaeria bacterium]
MRNFTMIAAALLAGLGFGCGCNSSRDIPAVKGFDAGCYLGVWYEIARLPNRFERDMTQVKAEYSALPDGRIRVVNSGVKAGAPTEITGVARSSGEADTGELEVSFFWPFYSDYRIIKLAPDYRFSVVVGADRGYLWVLSRTPELSPGEWREIRTFLKQHKFPEESLIFSWGEPGGAL